MRVQLELRAVGPLSSTSVGAIEKSRRDTHDLNTVNSGPILARAITVVVSLYILVGAAGCAQRIPEPVTAPGQSLHAAPHISWIIMSGGADNPDRDFICQPILAAIA